MWTSPPHATSQVAALLRRSTTAPYKNRAAAPTVARAKALSPGRAGCTLDEQHWPLSLDAGVVARVGRGPRAGPMGRGGGEVWRRRPGARWRCRPSFPHLADAHPRPAHDATTTKRARATARATSMITRRPAAARNIQSPMSRRPRRQRPRPIPSRSDSALRVVAQQPTHHRAMPTRERHRLQDSHVAPPVGIEPTTIRLRSACSAN